MNEDNNKKAQEEKEIKLGIKKKFLLTKLVLVVAAVFFGYFGFKYWQVSQVKSGNESASTNNEFFDVNEDYKKDGDDISDLTINEMKERGSEFVYQTLFKNQLQINDLKDEIKTLQNEFSKYKNRERIAKTILSYVDLRSILFGEEFSQEKIKEPLRNFEIISSLDENLANKFNKLKPLIENFSGKTSLSDDFAKLIPEMIAAKTPDNSFLNKIRRYLAKLVVIRRIDKKNPNDIDTIIAQSEEAIKKSNYQEALNGLIALDQTYHEILVDFLTKLNNAAEIQKIDEEIFNYLRANS